MPMANPLNPWRYVSSNPTNNPGEFDLWVDIIVGGKTNRICNWSDKPPIHPMTHELRAASPILNRPPNPR